MSELSGTDHLERVYGSTDQKTLSQAYDQWAETYDQDVQNFGYRIPGPLMGLFCRYVKPGESPILDAGAGTGINGEALATLGYRPVTALDLSAGMLAKAEAKGVYGSYIQAALGGSLEFPDNHFSAIVSGGTFTEGHAPASSFDELIRITKPGGKIVFTVLVKVYENHGFKEKQAQLEARAGGGFWR